MKKNTFFALLSAILVTACVQTKQPIEIQQKQVIENDSTAQWEINADYTTFHSGQDTAMQPNCNVFNDSLTILISELKSSFTAQAAELAHMYDSVGQAMPGPCQLYVRDSVFSATPDYISVRLLVYSYTGGAHGITAYYGLNYDLKNKTFLTNNDILDSGKSAQTDSLLKVNFRNPDSCFNEVPTTANYTALNFSPENVEFTYAQYTLGAYVCGEATVAVPRKDLEGIQKIR